MISLLYFESFKQFQINGIAHYPIAFGVGMQKIILEIKVGRQLIHIHILIEPVGSAVKYRITSCIIKDFLQTIQERISNLSLSLSVVKFQVKHKPVIRLWLDDVQEVVGLPCRFLTWIDDMVRQSRFGYVPPRVSKPRVYVAPRDASSHGNKVALLVVKVKVRLLLAVRTILITRYVYSEW